MSSLERAYKNCKRCYELAKPSDFKSNYENDKVYSAMNEAMRAVEASFIDRTQSYFQCLEACLNCDFSEPGIANVLKSKHGFDKKVKNQDK